MVIYHGSSVIVKQPEIMIRNYFNEFSHGFYCNFQEEEAIRRATRFGKGYLNEYEYEEDNLLNILKFDEMTEEWLDFIVACRKGNTHKYDIVEGPVANDVIYNYIQDFLDEKIPREAF